MTSKAKQLQLPEIEPVVLEPEYEGNPPVADTLYHEPKSEAEPIDISYELAVFDAPRLLNVPGSKPSEGLVIGDTVYIATADATGQPKLVVQSLQWFQTAYGKA